MSAVSFFEAKNSGRGIRRRAWGLPCAFVKWENFNPEGGLKPEDIDATDWEIEPADEQWQHFSRLFEISEGFTPNRRDKRAQELFRWFDHGARAQAAGKFNVTSIPETQQNGG